MASPPFQLEDQTDEDFFDKLINDDDEIDFTGSGPSLVEGDDSDEAKAFSNLSVSEVDLAYVDSGSTIGFRVEGEKDGEDGVLLALSHANENSVVVEESHSVIPSNANESGEVGRELEGALDSQVSKSSEASAISVKEVQWSSFHSDPHLQSGSEFESHTDFFNELGDNSGDPFENVANTDDLGADFTAMGGVSGNSVADLDSSSYGKDQDGQCDGSELEQNVDGQGLSSSQYWENLYPGWRYDPNTGQWHQLDGHDVTVTAHENANVNAEDIVDVNAKSVSDGVVSDQKSEIYDLHHTAQSAAGSLTEGCTNVCVSDWNQISQGNAEYPSHMMFDPQYPGWYYDTIAQEWKLLESYTPAINQSTSVDYNQQYQNKSIENYGSQGLGSQDHTSDWGGSVGNCNQQNTHVWQAQPVSKSETAGFTETQHLGDPYGLAVHVNSYAEQNQHLGDLYSSNVAVNSYAEQQKGFKPSGLVAPHEQRSRSFDCSNGVSGFQSFIPTEPFSQYHNQTKIESNQPLHFSPASLDSQKSAIFSQQSLQSGAQFSYAPREERSSAGRPPHALVTFGFGGKLIVVKNSSSFHTNSAHESQDSEGGVVNVFNLMDVAMEKSDASSFGLGACDYFHSLCQQSFPGPLVGGNVGNKELNKWIDDRIANCGSPYMDYRKGEVLRLLFSLLKITGQYYGILRSPFGTDQALKESDCPESAVAKLFASANRNGGQPSEYGAFNRCMQNLSSEAQIQATALEVQKLLVSGRKKEALECAQEGQLWGPALVLASQLGDQFYGDTVKQMALKQLVTGSPLRTLCLLIAGQPADVFSNATICSSLPGSVNTYQQPSQVGADCMLDEWEENLAIITANRTKDDEFVIIHLGDCLWKERGEVTAAHICYLVAEANFEPYSDSARMCLVGADHWKFPRTYASPEAIQMTELYEYSKVLGNSQFLLLPFQPYKLIYAHMLAEVGKVADSLKYCQAILKSLKTGRAPEVDTWKQLVLSLEERLRTHQQGGYSTNLAPTKLVGKLLTFIDSTAHRVVGGLPPPVPSTSHSSVKRNEFTQQLGGPKVSSIQSTMTMSSLIPSASVEPISEWTADTNQVTIPNRSISEPDFSSPRKAVSSKEVNSSDTQEKASVSGRPSRFGRFGSQLLQRTVGLVLRSRPDRQAKLGERNKFYYDEKLKRWVEEGAELPTEEVALPPPPPTTAAFQNGMTDHNIKGAPKIDSFHANSGPPSSSELGSGIPPIPTRLNQFSARGRMSVRSRYVDTFNKGSGTPATMFQSPSVPVAKPGGGSNPKFFIPTPIASSEETAQTTGENMQETVVTNENPPTSFKGDLFSSPPASTSSSSSLSMTMQRFPSMDNIVQKRTGAMADGNNSVSSHSRRVASWSGSLTDSLSPMIKEVKPLGELLAMPPPSQADPPSKQLSANRSNYADDLREVEL